MKILMVLILVLLSKTNHDEETLFKFQKNIKELNELILENSNFQVRKKLLYFH
jgi:hypothetical protein